jgi:beta-mannosidase
MQTQSLNGFWQFHQASTPDWLPAQVPGGVHTDLMAAGKLPDPFCGTNEEQVQWVAEKNWEYRRFFYPSALILRQDHVWLVCDGLDTLADVRLNGKILGQADNMYRTWRWDVKALLVEGENRLEIFFRSPVAYIRARERVRGRGSVQDPLAPAERGRGAEMNMGIHGGPHLRKTPSHFGWDWGPRLPCIGIWQGIRLEGSTRGQLGDIRFDQEHAPGVVTLTTRIQCELWERSISTGEERHTLRLRITGPDRQVWLLDAPARPQSNMTVTIPNPRLWWPNEYGEPNLYIVEVELLGSQDELIDWRKFHLGLRTIELRQVEDPTPAGIEKPLDFASGLAAKLQAKSFTFVVNGLPIFCKGSNWIPVDSFPTRVTPEQVENLVSAAAETHQNMLRVWGGGYYESETFYDLCDRYGILVWQDFQFACARYPLDDPAYLDNVRCEVVDNVRRLRHHASLALWCGNNEIEMLGVRMGWFKKTTQKEAHERFFFHQLPEILAIEDPQRLYWPGSPNSNQPFIQPNSEQAGDAHLWQVFAEFRLPSHYRQQNPRFVSEFGFQSLPDMQTIQKFALDEACKFDSPVMRCHQRAMGGNPRLLWYLAQRFRLPRTLPGLVYLSQVLQAEAIRTGVEHWRRHPEHTSGALYWQINDCWPVISWSSIDYYGQWKALHYAARRFYAPVLLSIEEKTGQGQHKMDVWVSNDRREAWQGRVHWTLETLDGEVIEGGDQPVLSLPQSANCLLKLDFAHHNGKVDWRRVIFVAEIWQENERQALQLATFLPELRMPIVDPGLHAEIHESGELLVIRVQARRLARFVELSLGGANVQFSDNFFDLPAGRMATIECEFPQGWTLDQARAALQVHSLAKMGPYDSLVASHWKGNLALIGSLLDMAWKGLIEPLIK